MSLHMDITTLFSKMLVELIRLYTGRMFNESEIRQITSHTVGKHFKDFFPIPEDEQNAKIRVTEAQAHIAKAGQFIASMQDDLNKQSLALDNLLIEIEEKKKIADKFRHLANTNKQQFQAFKEEIEETIRGEIIAQSEKGKAIRRLTSFFVWIITLFIGAGLGTYFKDIVAWAQTIPF